MRRPTRPAASGYPRVEVASRAALRRWLSRHHATSKGVWIVTRKRGAGGQVAWNDVVEEALCFGWVDSLPRKLDDERSMLLVTPRKASSRWSAKNQAHVADLERRGLMHASGRAVVAAARERGTWSALDAVSRLVVPRDLARALAARSPAREHWDAFPPSARRGILEWIEAAKRPETRAARVEDTARLARDGVRAHQWRPGGARARGVPAARGRSTRQDALPGRSRHAAAPGVGRRRSRGPRPAHRRRVR